MIPAGCSRLVENDFPVAAVSRHALREKNVRYGHPSTLHLWWARRPLAACRAMHLGLLLPDPCDTHCPEAFKARARELLGRVPGVAGELARAPSSVGGPDKFLRQGLMAFIGGFANWDASNHALLVEVARGLVQAAYGDETPFVVDPFAGGGSIPLEALRLGCDVFASDLNPVAAFILKVMLEDMPRSAPELLDRVERAGERVRELARQALRDFYPVDPDGAKPIAYLWARTVRCEAPTCGAEIPIFRSPWLSRRGATRARYFREAKDGRCAALVVESAPLGGPVSFRVAVGHGSEEPREGYVKLEGTKAAGNNANVICPCCKTVLSGNAKNPRVPTQLAAQHGGAEVLCDEASDRIGGARLLAVALIGGSESRRHFRVPTQADYRAVWHAQQALNNVVAAQGSSVPHEPLPPAGTLGFRVQRYGMLEWQSLFTARQKLAMLTLRDAIEEVAADDPPVREILALALSRFADICNALCQWKNTAQQAIHLFTRQAMSIVWDFVEPAIFAEQAGDFQVTLNTMLRVLRGLPRQVHAGQVQVADACASPLPSAVAHVWFTDPPYYDAVPYADLSDFFFVWLKRVFPEHPLLHDPFDERNPLTPKQREAVQDEVKTVDGRPKDKAFFEAVMARAFQEGRRVLREDGIGCVVFAHKTTEGWEALLSGMIRGGWVVTGSWPIVTESATRLRARESAALATSVHLICRPRPDTAGVGDWGEVLSQLPRRVGDWMERLQSEGVRGADLVFACIGPALEIFSRHEHVETAEGRTVELPEFLEKVWEVVGRAALEQVLGTAEARARNGAAGAVEEDGRLTALFLWTLQSTDIGASGAEDETAEEDGDEEENEEAEAGAKRAPKGYSLVFDVVRRFAQPLGIRLPDWEGRIIETQKGAVRLLSVTERAKQLFGKDGAEALADRLEREQRGTVQLSLFQDPDAGAAPSRRAHRSRAAVPDDDLRTRREATTLDRVHAGMLLQASGRTNALRALLDAEADRGPDFIRLANALSALYPRDSEEKRLLDAMLLAAPR